MTEPCNLARNLSKSLGKHFVEFTELKAKYQSEIEELSKRLANLEEKERVRARDEHNKEILLNYDPESEGIEKVRCIECKTFVSYEDAYVEGHSVNEDGQTVEDCICKWCKKERE